MSMVWLREGSYVPEGECALRRSSFMPLRTVIFGPAAMSGTRATSSRCSGSSLCEKARTVSTTSCLRDIQGPFRSEREIARIIESGHHHSAGGRRRNRAGDGLRNRGDGQSGQSRRNEECVKLFHHGLLWLEANIASEAVKFHGGGIPVR